MCHLSLYLRVKNEGIVALGVLLLCVGEVVSNHGVHEVS